VNLVVRVLVCPETVDLLDDEVGGAQLLVHGIWASLGWVAVAEVLRVKPVAVNEAVHVLLGELVVVGAAGDGISLELIVDSSQVVGGDAVAAAETADEVEVRPEVCLAALEEPVNGWVLLALSINGRLELVQGQGGKVLQVLVTGGRKDVARASQLVLVKERKDADGEDLGLAGIVWNTLEIGVAHDIVVVLGICRDGDHGLGAARALAQGHPLTEPAGQGLELKLDVMSARALNGIVLNLAGGAAFVRLGGLCGWLPTIQ